MIHCSLTSYIPIIVIFCLLYYWKTESTAWLAKLRNQFSFTTLLPQISKHFVRLLVKHLGTLEDTDCVHCIYEHFRNVLPWTLPTKKKMTPPSRGQNPWLNPELLYMAKRKHDLYAQFVKSGDLALQNEFKKYINWIRNQSTAAKDAYFVRISSGPAKKKSHVILLKLNTLLKPTSNSSIPHLWIIMVRRCPKMLYLTGFIKSH